MNKIKVGYFGGTFDPPHLGHIILAAEVKYHLELEKVRWIITPDPPHKKDQVITPINYRLEMLELVVENLEGFELSLVDIQRDPPHYAADTVEILKSKDPSEELVYLIGEDSLMDLPEWYQPNRFLENIDQLAVVPRPGIKTDLDQLEQSMPGLLAKTTFITDVMIEVSSSLIRERAREHAPFEHFLLDSVADYIKDKQLYLP